MAMEERELFNIGAEQQVLAVLMGVKGAEYIDRVNEYVFYREAHKVIFKAIKEVLTEDKASVADITLVMDKLKAKNRLEDIGDLPYLMSINSQGMFTGNFNSYLDTIRDYAELRAIKRVATETLATINGSGIETTASDIKEQFKDRLNNIKSGITELEYKDQNDENALVSFWDNIMDEERGRCYSTGFSELDRALSGGLYAGLYVLGAVSGLGKTTYAMQVACNLAKSGADVLFFSLEMARNELLARNISRTTAEMSVARFNNVRIARSNSEIMSGATFIKSTEDEQKFIYEAIDKYKEYAGHIYTIEGNFDLTVEHIRGRISKHIEATGNKPVVFVDYLQILGVEAERNGKSITDKQKADRIVSFLKRTSRDLDVPIIVVSSFNRESYNNPVEMNSFKDSGGIEYSADVLLGMQLKGIELEQGETLKDGKRLARVHQLHERVKEKKNSGEGIDIELKLLKNRRGTQATLDYTFFSRFSLFTEKKTGLGAKL